MAPFQVVLEALQEALGLVVVPVLEAWSEYDQEPEKVGLAEPVLELEVAEPLESFEV